MEFWEANGTSGPSVVEITAPTTLASYNSVIRYSQTQSYHRQADFYDWQNWLTRQPSVVSLLAGLIYLYLFVFIDLGQRDNIWQAGPDLSLTEPCLHQYENFSLPPSLNTHQAPGQNFCSTVKTSKQKLGEINFCWNHQVSFILNYKISERRKIKAFTRISSQPDGRGPHLEKSYS